ncbi:MAG: hypothetical protein Q9159_004517 [Coniocarpon cinnabarinum]
MDDFNATIMQKGRFVGFRNGKGLVDITAIDLELLIFSATDDESNSYHWALFVRVLSCASSICRAENSHSKRKLSPSEEAIFLIARLAPGMTLEQIKPFIFSAWFFHAVDAQSRDEMIRRIVRDRSRRSEEADGILVKMPYTLSESASIAKTAQESGAEKHDLNGSLIRLRAELLERLRRDDANSSNDATHHHMYTTVTRMVM